LDIILEREKAPLVVQVSSLLARKFREADLSAADMASCTASLDVFFHLRASHNGEHLLPQSPASSRLIFQLLTFAHEQAPQYAAAFVNTGDFCYGEAREQMCRAERGDGVELTAAEAELASSLLQGRLAPPAQGFRGATTAPTAEGPEMLLRAIYSVLRHHHFDVHADESDAPSNSDITYGEDAARAAMKEAVPSWLPLPVVEQLVMLWRSIHVRSHELLAHSAECFFKYLRLLGGHTSDARPTPLSSDIESQASREEPAATLKATLRLLKLIVQHGDGLQDVLERGLNQTPLRAWLMIVPQLFSRLGSAGDVQRAQLTNLLCRIAQTYPHAVLYAAVTGVRDVKGPSLQCFQAIRIALDQQHHTMVAELESMIKELQRITVLWEESWLDLMSHRQTEVTRRMQQLTEEAQRLQGNLALSAAEKVRLMEQKHEALFRPVAHALRDLHERTVGRGAETRHERWFVKQFGAKIEGALRALTSGAAALAASARTRAGRLASSVPISEAYSAELACAPVKRLYDDLRAAVSAQKTLALSDVSPTLASIKDTRVSMPGVGVHSVSGASIGRNQVVHLAGFHARVIVLPTKTRPKKLTLRGSDGRRYTYLFKGMEDLHLDERMMQFLDAINILLQPLAMGSSTLLRARNYHVVPLGQRTGLIQWVENVEPVFRLYKTWQQKGFNIEQRAYEAEFRRQQEQESARGRRDKAKGKRGKGLKPPTAPLRPSAQFYNKLTPALKAAGVSSLASRSKWPIQVLIKVRILCSWRWRGLTVVPVH
jgi:PI-3-kinase-related kinase SMG-1